MLGYFLSYNSHTISNVVTILRAGLHPFLQMAIPSHRKGVAIRSKRCSLVKCVLRMLLAGIIAACIESVSFVRVCFYTASSEEEKEAQESTVADNITPTV